MLNQPKTNMLVMKMVIPTLLHQLWVARPLINAEVLMNKQGTQKPFDEMVIGETAFAIKNPTHWAKTLYANVIEVEGFE